MDARAIRSLIMYCTLGYTFAPPPLFESLWESGFEPQMVDML